MKSKILGLLIMFVMLFSVKELASAKTITANDFANEINKFSQYGVSANVDSTNKKITINYSGTPLMVATYNDSYIEYNGRGYTNEYYSNHRDEMTKRYDLTYPLVESINNLYGITKDQYEQYGIQFEESGLAVTGDGVATPAITVWDEISYFKLPLNTTDSNNGTTSNTNTTGSEVNNGTTSNTNTTGSEVNNGTTTNTTNTSSEENKGTTSNTNNTSSQVNSESTTNTNTVATNNNNESSKDTTQYNPNTGDNIVMYFGVLALLIIGSVITARKVIFNK